MAGYRSIAGSGYGSPYIDALIAGGAVWDTRSEALTFGFGHQFKRSAWLSQHGAPKEDNGRPYLIPGVLVDTWWATSWDIGKAAPMLLALEQAELVSNLNVNVDLNFSTDHVSNANLVVFTTDLDNWEGGAVWAAAETPQERSQIQSNKAWLYLNTIDDGAWEVPHPGGMGFTMMLNMLGTALGLSQAHQQFPGVTSAYDPGPNGLNQAPFTVMSANWSYQGSGEPSGEWGSMKTFGAFDIAALQKIYGVNTTTATGDNVYELPTYNSWNGAWGIGRATGWSCIWDAGGTDTISAQNAKEGVTIDLRSATLASGDPNAGGFLSQQPGVAGGFTIANGTVIENAIGGSGNDVLIGNAAKNVLNGGLGDDIYYIDSPSDVIIDAGGNDTVYATFDFKHPSIENVFVNNVPAKAGGAPIAGGYRILLGTSGKNKLVGGATDDRLYGKAGNDILTGGKGKDIFVFDTKPNKKSNFDKITDFNVKDDTIWLENKVFAKLGKKGTEKKPAALNKKFFTLSDKAKDKDDYIVYDNKKGILYYDADGSGAGKAVEIATLSKKLKMTYKDFFVI